MAGVPDIDRQHESLSCYVTDEPQESQLHGLRSFLTFMGFQLQLLRFRVGDSSKIARGLGNRPCSKFSRVVVAVDQPICGGVK